jgi:dihydrofolate synthase/folylpolyglutamate synthase
VIEAGLGGRLDATNVVAPELTVVTRIGLDHREILGETIEAIAAEKAGIFKPGIPAVIAPQLPAAEAVLSRAASAAGAPLVRAAERARLVAIDRVGPAGTDVRFDVAGLGPVAARLALVGRHQVENAGTALAALSVLAERSPALGLDAAAARVALAEARWPGRFEACPGEPRLWWDGAHNPDGARAVRAAWREALGDPPGALVLGVSEDKDLAGMLAELAGPWRRVHAVAAASARAVPPAELAERVRAAWPGIEATAHAGVAEGVRAALARLGEGEKALVAGSLFVVGEAMSALGVVEAACG